jgi:hypothetical protein
MRGSVIGPLKTKCAAPGVTGVVEDVQLAHGSHPANASAAIKHPAAILTIEKAHAAKCLAHVNTELPRLMLVLGHPSRESEGLLRTGVAKMTFILKPLRVVTGSDARRSILEQALARD